MQCQLIEIDALHLQPPQAHFDALPQVLRTADLLPLVRTGAGETALGRNQQVLRIGIKSLSNNVFADLRAVRVRGMMKFTPSSTARCSTLRASSRSLGSPPMPGPVMRMAPSASQLIGEVHHPARMFLLVFFLQSCHHFFNLVAPPISFILRVDIIAGRSVQPTATIVGAGPNSLAAAIVLAQSGFSHGGAGSSFRRQQAPRARPKLTLPGFVHDFRSTFHPLAVTSPSFSTLPLAEAGLRWVWPPAELAHPSIIRDRRHAGA